ncbi:glycosyltransferase [Terrilactibacillus sp. S3-3]|nr:glycosyltransferase [Terrilactibacillus sp. S3-3]
MTVIGKGWHNHIPKRKRKHPYLQIIDRWIPPDKAALFYCNAKIVLNPHRSHLLHVNNNRFNIENRSLNNRTFDIAACQAFQLIDNKEVAPSFADRDIATFSSCQDCVEKITYYLTHEAIRKKKAENARQQVLAEHLMIHRAAEINKLVQAYRKNR